LNLYVKVIYEVQQVPKDVVLQVSDRSQIRIMQT